MSKQKRRHPNRLKRKGISPELAKQLSLEATIGIITTALCDGKGGLSVRIDPKATPELISAALPLLSLQVDYGSRATLIVPLYRLPCVPAVKP